MIDTKKSFPFFLFLLFITVITVIGSFIDYKDFFNEVSWSLLLIFTPFIGFYLYDTLKYSLNKKIKNFKNAIIVWTILICSIQLNNDLKISSLLSFMSFYFLFMSPILIILGSKILKKNRLIMLSYYIITIQFINMIFLLFTSYSLSSGKTVYVINYLINNPFSYPITIIYLLNSIIIQLLLITNFGRSKNGGQIVASDGLLNFFILLFTMLQYNGEQNEIGSFFWILCLGLGSGLLFLYALLYIETNKSKK